MKSRIEKIADWLWCGVIFTIGLFCGILLMDSIYRDKLVQTGRGYYECDKSGSCSFKFRVCGGDRK